MCLGAIGRALVTRQVRRVAVAGADLLSRVCSFLLAKTGTIFFNRCLGPWSWSFGFAPMCLTAIEAAQITRRLCPLRRALLSISFGRAASLSTSAVSGRARWTKAGSPRYKEENARCTNTEPAGTLSPFSSLPQRPRLDLLGQQLVRQVLSVA